MKKLTNTETSASTTNQKKKKKKKLSYWREVRQLMLKKIKTKEN